MLLRCPWTIPACQPSLQGTTTTEDPSGLCLDARWKISTWKYEHATRPMKSFAGNMQNDLFCDIVRTWLAVLLEEG
jgi:hypothetical protein